MPLRAGAGRIGAILTAILALLLVVALGELASSRSLMDWDARIMDRLASGRNPSVAGWMGLLSVTGGWIAIPLGVLVAYVLYRRGQRRSAACYIVTVLSGWALNGVLKAAVHRPRPHGAPFLDGAGWYSYPSGHAMLAPLVFGLGAVLLSRGARPRTAAIIVAAGLGLTGGIAFSRVYLGVHYSSDVIGALVAGSAWAVLGVASFSPLESPPCHDRTCQSGC